MRKLPLFLGLTLLVGFTVAFAQGRGEGSGLGSAMEDLERTLQSIGEAMEADEPTYTESLGEACRLQKVVIDAKSEEPRMFKSLADNEKKLAKMRVEYRETMHLVLNGLFVLELKLLEEDAKGVKKALREIENLESKGHGKFRPKRGGR